MPARFLEALLLFFSVTLQLSRSTSSTSTSEMSRLPEQRRDILTALGLSDSEDELPIHGAPDLSNAEHNHIRTRQIAPWQGSVWKLTGLVQVVCRL